MSESIFIYASNDPSRVRLAKELEPLVAGDPNGPSHALAVAFAYADIDGGHHKQWVIDQMVRAITGENYQEFLDTYNDPEYGEWDEGIAP